jgi:hypothetical protein
MGHRPRVVSEAAGRHAVWRGGATRLWSMPATAGEPRHDAGAPPSHLPTRRDSSLGGLHYEYRLEKQAA